MEIDKITIVIINSICSIFWNGLLKLSIIPEIELVINWTPKILIIIETALMNNLPYSRKGIMKYEDKMEQWTDSKDECKKQ